MPITVVIMDADGNEREETLTYADGIEVPAEVDGPRDVDNGVYVVTAIAPPPDRVIDKQATADAHGVPVEDVKIEGER